MAAVRQATVPLAYKKDLLKTVWDVAGAGTVLTIGQGIGKVSYDPVWQAALRSVSPCVLMDKWTRFEIFAHSQNRVRFDYQEQDKVTCERYTVEGGKPGTAENFLICGLLIALLENIGCQQLRCDMPLNKHQPDGTEGSTHCLYKNRQFNIPEDLSRLNSLQWQFQWQDFTPGERQVPSTGDLPGNIDGLPDIFDSSSVDFSKPVAKIADLLKSDVSRLWTIEELAREAGMSERSLQRRLTEAGFSFSRLVRMIRVLESCRLLDKTDTSITAIGFCTGFSDSAHFSRDFRASIGMTPRDYRALLRQGA